jgi:hypothetical protein
LGLWSVEVAEVDLSQLLEGSAFTLSYTISNNGLGIKTLSLIDTEANRLIFIDTKFAATTGRYLGINLSPIHTSCKVRSFDSKQTILITHYIKITLIIDGQ